MTRLALACLALAVALLLRGAVDRLALPLYGQAGRALASVAEPATRRR